MYTVVHDLRYAARILAKQPGFTLAIVTTLALGIGANTAIFSVINGILLAPLPYTDGDRLAVIWETNRESGTRAPASYPNFRDWIAQNDVFEDIACVQAKGFTLTGLDAPKRVRGARVSPGFFSLLGVTVAHGRSFDVHENEGAGTPVAVVSDGFWQRHFGGKPNLIGGTIILDGTSFTVVGILPPGFDFSLKVPGAEVWVPAALATRFVDSRGAHGFLAVARLAPGITWPQAQAGMDTVARRLEEAYPDTNAGWGVHLVSLHEELVGRVRPGLLLLFGAVSLVLIIACANVANLLLARGTAREQEFAVRAALGAGRGRLSRQLLTESLLVGVIGGALGILFALWGTDALVRTAPGGLPNLVEVGVDARVLLFAFALAVLTGLLFGLLPTVRATGLRVPVSLKRGGASAVPSPDRHRLGGALVVVEVAMALVLLMGAGLLTRSFGRLMEVDLGFEPDRLLTFRMTTPSDWSTSTQERAAFYDETLARLQILPGVREAAAASSLPHTRDAIGVAYRHVGHPEPEEAMALYDAVSADYFRAMQIPLVAGRWFTAQDTLGQPPVILINEAMARQLTTDNPLGARLSPSIRLGKNAPDSYEVIGIVGDVRDAVDMDPDPHMYVSLQQQVWPSACFVVRTEHDPAALTDSVRRAMASITSHEPPYAFAPMRAHLSKSVAIRQSAMTLVGIFAVVALALALVGIYGLLSYTTAQRTHEIGVRMALGAKREDVLRLVLRRGLMLTLIGVGMGTAVSALSAHVLSDLLFEVSTLDLTTFVGVPLILLSVALLACYLPARRASRVDPLAALRCE
jgi:putative ABC transport system permease protein